MPPGGVHGLLLAAVLLYALNLRAPITALAPVVDDVAAGLGLSAAGVGVLTGLPVLCFAVAAPAASALIERLGIEKVVSLSLLTILLGTILRSSGSFAGAVVGTTLIGVAITAGNIAVPTVIRRDFPGSASTVTGMYTSALNIGSVFATALTAPLAEAVGWQWALVAWTVLVPVAWIPWRLAARQRAEQVGAVQPPRLAPVDAETGSVLRRPMTWILAVMFGGQSFGYFAATAWMPSLLQDVLGIGAGAAGGAASLFQLFAVAGALGVPLALGRGVGARPVFVVIAAAWVALPVGLLVAPAFWPLWVGLAGAAQGGNFTVIFTVIVQRARTVGEARQTSAVVQTVGYAIAATGPSLFGAAHEASGGWTASLLLLLGVLLVMTAAGLLATPREGTSR
ncbi:CynX/NimT family MFS transporter [Paraoerskovia marina]|uniref:MFS transporter n=1 Tax=Paraoerskovia marina TaxID=545619 RepID=UPI0004925D31|nr:MFS transporter [Paraoerskovia marina]